MKEYNSVFDTVTLDSMFWAFFVSAFAKAEKEQLVELVLQCILW